MNPVLSFHENGNVKYKEYYINGKFHRENGPAREKFYENGNIAHRAYYIHGNVHRTDGPAYEGFYENGSIKYIYFYINGKYLSEETFYALTNNLEIFE